MIPRLNRSKSTLRRLASIAFAATLLAYSSHAAPTTQSPARRAAIDDSVNRTPAADLALRPPNVRKADALAQFVEGARLEENAEMESALAAYEKVLDVDPGEAELASRVATLLTRQGDVPRAVDVLKDAIKAKPNEPAPYLQLAFIYAKHLKKMDQALKYANEAVGLDPKNIDAWQRLFEIEIAMGDPHKAMSALDRARAVQSDDPLFWIRLGKLYATLIFRSDNQWTPDGVRRVNEIFERAAALGKDDASTVKEVADYYAASQQIQQAIPLYLRVLELQPDDANAREKLATSFILTNDRPKAIDMLQQIIKEHPENANSYDLLAQLLDDDARALLRDNQTEPAKAQFAKAAANYEQSILINPTRPASYLRLAQLFIGPVKQPERAIALLDDARLRFSESAEFTYLLALAQREAKQSAKAVTTFEEALQEAENTGAEFINARFYFDYAIAADQAGLHDKAADLLRQSITADPPNGAEAYNYLAYMWAEQNAHLDEAEDAVKHALDLDANNGAYLDTLGWINYRKGKFHDALTELTRAEQNLPRPDAVIFEHIGDTYAKLNRVPQAMEYWQKALALDAKNKPLADKIENTKTKISKGPATNGPVK
ncbi:MAG: tetratricopeptide repeat protein [Chthoniobacterales bacterium]